VNRLYKAWLDFHKYSSSEEIVGKHFSTTQVDQDLASAQEIVEGLINDRKSVSGEFSRRCKDGSIGYHQFTVGPVFKEDSVLGLDGFIIDITEKKITEEALKERTRELERFNKIMVNREMRIIEMKTKINELSTELGREIPYPPIWEADADR